MATPKWTPAEPTQVVNFILLYFVSGWIMSGVEILLGRDTHPFSTWYLAGTVPVLLYGCVYSLVVWLRRRRSPAAA